MLERPTIESIALIFREQGFVPVRGCWYQELFDGRVGTNGLGAVLLKKGYEPFDITCRLAEYYFGADYAQGFYAGWDLYYISWDEYRLNLISSNLPVLPVFEQGYKQGQAAFIKVFDEWSDFRRGIAESEARR